MDAPAANYDPRRFRTAVPFYVRYRLGYPEPLLARVAEIAGAAQGDAVLDLGSGPGLLAVPFAQAGFKVTAVDPEPEMLKAAVEAAKAAGVDLDLRQGSSFDLPAGIGPFKLVVIGRAFHWMDRAQTLRDLEGIVAGDGAIALFGESHPRTVENNWRRVIRDIRERYGAGESARFAERAKAGYRSDESLLLASPFRDLERVGFFIRRTVTIDDVLGHAYSQSSSLPEKLGDRAPLFEQDARRSLLRLAPDGKFTHIAELTALVARRSRAETGAP